MNNDNTAFGLIAHDYCHVKRPLRILRSAQGYYIGTLTEDGLPLSRESNEYFQGHAIAKKALENGNWSQRLDA